MSFIRISQNIQQGIKEFSDAFVNLDENSVHSHIQALASISVYISNLAETYSNQNSQETIQAGQIIAPASIDSQSSSQNTFQNSNHSGTINHLKDLEKTIQSTIQQQVLDLLQLERSENVMLRNRIHNWIENENLVPPVGFTFNFEISDKLKQSVKNIETYCLKKTGERVIKAFQSGKQDDTNKSLDWKEGREFTEMLECLDQFKEQTIQLVDQCDRYTMNCKEKFKSQAAEIISINEFLKSKATYYASQLIQLQNENKLLSEKNVQHRKKVDALMDENSQYRHQIDDLSRSNSSRRSKSRISTNPNQSQIQSQSQTQSQFQHNIDIKTMHSSQTSHSSSPSPSQSQSQIYRKIEPPNLYPNDKRPFSSFAPRRSASQQQMRPHSGGITTRARSTTPFGYGGSARSGIHTGSNSSLGHNAGVGSGIGIGTGIGASTGIGGENKLLLKDFQMAFSLNLDKSLGGYYRGDDYEEYPLAIDLLTSTRKNSSRKERNELDSSRDRNIAMGMKNGREKSGSNSSGISTTNPTKRRNSLAEESPRSISSILSSVNTIDNSISFENELLSQHQNLKSPKSQNSQKLQIAQNFQNTQNTQNAQNSLQMNSLQIQITSLSPRLLPSSHSHSHSHSAISSNTPPTHPTFTNSTQTNSNTPTLETNSTPASTKKKEQTRITLNITKSKTIPKPSRLHKKEIGPTT